MSLWSWKIPQTGHQVALGRKKNRGLTGTHSHGSPLIHASTPTTWATYFVLLPQAKIKNAVCLSSPLPTHKGPAYSKTIIGHLYFHFFKNLIGTNHIYCFKDSNYFQLCSNCTTGSSLKLITTNTVKILKFGTPQTIAIIVLKIEKFDVTLH